MTIVLNPQRKVGAALTVKNRLFKHDHVAHCPDQRAKWANLRVLSVGFLLIATIAAIYWSSI